MFCEPSPGKSNLIRIIQMDALGTCMQDCYVIFYYWNNI